MALLKWLFSPILLVTWPLILFFDHRRRDKQYRRDINRLQSALAEASARRTELRVSSEKTLWALWRLHHLPDRAENILRRTDEIVTFEEEEQVNLLAKWIDVLYGEQSFSGLAEATFSRLGAIKYEAPVNEPAEDSDVMDEMRITVMPPVEHLVRVLTDLLPLYDSVPKSGFGRRVLTGPDAASRRSLEWLYHEQLRIGDQWAISLPNGFRWWADEQAQTIQIVREEAGSDGRKRYLLAVQTDLFQSLDLEEQALTLIGSVIMPFASMSGPVYSAKDKSLHLCSMVWVHNEIAAWMLPLISLSAVLQIGEARILGRSLATTLGANEAKTAHPSKGVRLEPDELAEAIATLISPEGKEASRWSLQEFQSAAGRYMSSPPAISTQVQAQGLTFSLPFGKAVSSCQMKADEPHPRYGNGLLLLQSFPLTNSSAVAGYKLALDLNAVELTGEPFGYGFGSYAIRDNNLHFSMFIPNSGFRPGMLPNLYASCVQRARALSEHLKCSGLAMAPARRSENKGDWPQFEEFEQSERGYNDYRNAWIGRRRRATMLSQIPMAAIDDHRAAVALAQEQGWNEYDS